MTDTVGHQQTLQRLVLAAVFFAPVSGHADSSAIDKIYHPYVQPLEREFEARAIFDDRNPSNLAKRNSLRIGYGQSFSDNWFGEFYLIGSENGNRGFRLTEYEVEALWQLTEQGEYSADWGLLFEIERSIDTDVTEFSTAILVEKEWGHWNGTANLYGIYEFGDDIKTEFETALNLQARYRYSRHFEPAIELYKAQNTFGLGPVILGSQRIGGGKRLRWEAGVIFGVDSTTPDNVFKGVLEYEFR